MTGREKTAVRRQQIIAATLDVLGRVPLADLTTRLIANALGLSQPALFRHFRSRDALLRAALDHAHASLGDLVDGVLRGAAEPIARLEHLAAGVLAYAAAHPGVPRLLFGDVGPAPGDAELRAALRRLVSAQRAVVATLVRDGQRRGELRAGLDPERAGAFFVGLIQGAILQWELADRAEPLTAYAAPLVHQWLHGAREPDPTRATATRQETTAVGAPDAPAPPRPTLRTLDARPLLARGEDPLRAILAELGDAGASGLVCVTTPFLPKPLVTLLTEQGHGVEVFEVGAGTYSVEVVPGGGPIVDLVDLPAPEPLERVLALTVALPSGATLAVRLPRVPQLLLPRLTAHGVVHAVHERPDGRALLLVVAP
jgi:AcrR family transcriptional regulator